MLAKTILSAVSIVGIIAMVFIVEPGINAKAENNNECPGITVKVYGPSPEFEVKVRQRGGTYDQTKNTDGSTACFYPVPNGTIDIEAWDYDAQCNGGTSVSYSGGYVTVDVYLNNCWR